MPEDIGEFSVCEIIGTNICIEFHIPKLMTRVVLVKHIVQLTCMTDLAYSEAISIKEE